MIGISALEEIALQVADRRALIKTAAEHSGQKEYDLVQKIAGIMKLPAVENVPVLDTAVLSDTITRDLLRRTACVPILEKGKICGIVCVDPELLVFPGKELRSQPVALSTWSTIAAALEEPQVVESEGASGHEELEDDAQEVALTEGEAQDVTALVKEVLAYVWSQASAFEVESVRLYQDDGSVFYSFVLPDGRKGSGTIDNSVRECLFEELEAYAEEEAAFELSEELKLGVQQCEDDDLGSLFELALYREPRFGDSIEDFTANTIEMEIPVEVRSSSREESSEESSEPESSEITVNFEAKSADVASQGLP